MSVDLAWHAYGNGPPLVILHGLFGAGRNWRSIADRLAHRWRVYTVDLRNHGSSPWAPTMSFAEMADDLAAFFFARQLYSAALIGHSLGGKTAMLFALHHPALIDDLIVVDIAPAAYDHSYRSQVAAMQAVDLARVRRRRDVEAMLAAAVDEPAMRTFLVQNLKHSADGGFAWRVNLEAIGESLPDLMGWPDVGDREFPNRALFVSGEHSGYIGRQHQAAIFAHFPQAEFAVIRDAGHRVHADQPTAFVDAVTRFLDSATA